MAMVLYMVQHGTGTLHGTAWQWYFAWCGMALVLCMVQYGTGTLHGAVWQLYALHGAVCESPEMVTA